MATHDIAITNCSFDASGCVTGGHKHAVCLDCDGDAQIFISNNNVSCGHCQQLVMPNAAIVTRIDFRCEGGIEVWTQKLPGCPGVEIHRCESDTFTVTDEEIAALLTSIPLDAP